jgi:diguanylate cyclase (GGDEF)-like protein
MTQVVEVQQLSEPDGGSGPDVAVRALVAEFTNPDIERDFLESKVEVDARRLSSTLLFGAFIFPLFSIPDFLTYGVTQTTLLLLTCELIVSTAAVVHALRLRQVPSRVLSGFGVTALEAMAMACLLPVVALRPEQVQALNLTYCVLVLALFAFIPNRFILVLPVCIAGYVSMVLITSVGYPPQYRNNLRSVMALATITMVGAWIGNTLQRSRREEFASVLQERWSNQRLLEEIARRRELEEELVWLADHDTLTDVWNRRAFYERADRMMDLVRANRRPMSVLIIDADHFKSINDDHGHHVGDEAIRTLAALCKGNLRASDVLGRVGGEEFAVLMPDTSLHTAEEVASRLRESVARATIEHTGGRLSVTVSIGVVECHRDVESVQEALQRADAAMYEAKAGGRNRVVALAG